MTPVEAVGTLDFFLRNSDIFFYQDHLMLMGKKSKPETA